MSSSCSAPERSSEPQASVARRASKLLSGYLCGTHSGVLARGRRSSQRQAETAALAHRAFESQPHVNCDVVLGGDLWTLEDVSVRDELQRSLHHPAVHDLVLFGSQARGGTTGFSDIDAILVISDASADNPTALRSLRPRILAAQRTVLAHQPMQHHGFEVATPRLLQQASAALALPTAAVQETRSLYGREVVASFVEDAEQAHAAFLALASQLREVPRWPGHIWKAHRMISMFELLPVLYLQARGRSTPKWLSFDQARVEFEDLWWPYDVLQEVRASWPRSRRRALELVAAAARNPWAAVAAWRRLPAPLPAPMVSVHTGNALEGLRTLVRTMLERAG